MLFDTSIYCEIVFTDAEEVCSLIFNKHGTIWYLSGKSKDLDGIVEIESTPEGSSLFELMASIEIKEPLHEWFEGWFMNLYQEISKGYVKRALFESAPPTEFETRLEERLTWHLHETTQE